MFEQLPVQLAGQKRKRAVSHALQPTPQLRHPYLTGNFAPIQQTLPLTACTYTGTIPLELADGEYVRNGSNPVSNADLGRDAHWFDGDGMLAGVSFPLNKETGMIEPEFVNAFILTDLYLSSVSSPHLRHPILPSIAALVNPLYSFLNIGFRVMRTILLVVLSWLPGSKQVIKKISVANTNVVFHDGRALATCESGPPMRVLLPGLETVGWYNGASAEGEKEAATQEEQEVEKVLGQDDGLLGWMREWTTAHPKIDPLTKEMLMFHSSFAPPYVQYSIIPSKLESTNSSEIMPRRKLLNAPVPGISTAKMMHDFGVSLTRTVIMDLPLSLDPMNQLKGQPPVSYDQSKPSRFGVFPRQRPEEVKWFETDACCIFHTANTWDDISQVTGEVEAVNMLACRLTSATLVFAAGNIAPPVPRKAQPVKAKRMPFFSKYHDDARETTIYENAPLLESPKDEKDAFIVVNGKALDNEEELKAHLWDEDQCRLYYYNFDLTTGQIAQQWALATIAFEFPSVRPDREMQDARYIYGCSTSTTSFGSALGKATKIDVLVKIDAKALIERGLRHPPRSVTGAVDTRSMDEILERNEPENGGDDDSIQAFLLPEGWYAQEPRFVPRGDAEDDGYLLFYAFDESQLNSLGDVPADDQAGRACSELWVIDARDMKTVVARVKLPQRVPYGLHGTWFDAGMVGGQREVEGLRSTTIALGGRERGVWMGAREWVERMLG
ncbi:hypothetical protein LTR62_000713 [Meristemomyces frigidus]|uniref:Carotenoid oxygenase n=1 Tax=Meristemomyces frigidus TaxID=1508187 RepID=A0AAN7YC01_9PEZI|nr:hypothetical protein LTR62_000713 [Meristemomyces frigidus]